MNKKLYKSEMDRMLCGVCGGFGDYFGVDPTLIRLIFAVLTCFGIVPGLIIYFIAALVMPDESNCY